MFLVWILQSYQVPESYFLTESVNVVVPVLPLDLISYGPIPANSFPSF